MSEEEAAGPSRAGRVARWLLRIRPVVWLAVGMAGYFAVALALSWLRVEELVPGTWDLGLYQQALWSTAHGRPFYEAADWETGGFHSLLQVHSVLLLYVLVPIYALLPSSTTLLVCQSAVVTLAAVPLFYLGKHLGGNDWYGVGAAGAYLLWAPTLAANLYDFHAEAFLPLEIFAVLLFWEQGRYRLGAIAVVAAFLTIEVAPVLLFFVGIFFLLPSTSEIGRILAPPREAPGASPGGSLRATALRAWWTRPRTRAAFGLVVASAAAYGFLVYLRLDYLTAVLGTTPSPFPVSGYILGATPAQLGLAGSYLIVAFPAKWEYWFVMFGLLGFVPFLAPRALVLTAPWFVFTMFSYDPDLTTLGFQYNFIVAAGLLPAFAYALPRLVRTLDAGWSRPAERVEGSPPTRPGRPRRIRAVLLVGVAVFVAVNLVFSPVDPLMQNQSIGSGYNLSYQVPAGYEDVAHLAAVIPSNATVVASDNLFPLVANDGNAYSFSWTQDNFLVLPFNATALPDFVFVDQFRIGAVPSWLQGLLYAPDDFAVRGIVWSSAIGPVVLYQHGYEGPLTSFGAPPVLPLRVDGAQVVDPEAGYAPTGAVLGKNQVAASAPGVLGTFFWGPAATLPEGNLTVTVWLAATPTPGMPAPLANESVVWIGSTAWGLPSFFGWTLPYSYFLPGTWTAVTFNISLPGPILEFNLQGVSLATNVQVVFANATVASRATV